MTTRQNLDIPPGKDFPDRQLSGSPPRLALGPASAKSSCYAPIATRSTSVVAGSVVGSVAGFLAGSVAASAATAPTGATPAAASSDAELLMPFVTTGRSLSREQCRKAERGLSDESAWVLGVLSTTRCRATPPSSASFFVNGTKRGGAGLLSSSSPDLWHSTSSAVAYGGAASPFCIKGREMCGSSGSGLAISPSPGDLRAAYGAAYGETLSNQAHPTLTTGKLGAMHLVLPQRFYRVDVPVDASQKKLPGNLNSQSVTVSEEVQAKRAADAARRAGMAAEDPQWVQRRVAQGRRLYARWGDTRRSIAAVGSPARARQLQRSASAAAPAGAPLAGHPAQKCGRERQL